MKASKYNIFSVTDRGQETVFNTVTCALAEIDDTFKRLYRSIDTMQVTEMNKEDTELIEAMKDAGFIVEGFIDERKALKYQHYMGKMDQSMFGLTIAPTLACNFACPYCYEDAGMGAMSLEIQDALIENVRRMASNGRDIDITWYGGEPLMALDIIQRLSEAFIDICDTHKRRYSAFIVTNGYGVNPKVIETLKACRISGAQITLDGGPKTHNERRILKGTKGGTFDRVLENTKLLKTEGFNVNIRVNVDRTNFSEVNELVDILIDHNLTDLPTGLGHVTAYTEVCSSVAESCLDMEEYASLNNDFQKLLYEKGMLAHIYPYYPGVKANYCCADTLGAFVVDPEGHMYKCWNDVGYPEKAVSMIQDFHAPSEKMFTLGLDYLMWTPFDHEKCVKCKFLPICMGGCPYKGMAAGNEPDCEKWRYNIKDIIEITCENQPEGIQ